MHRMTPYIALALLLTALPAAATPTATDSPARGATEVRHWLGPDHQLLPFRSDLEVLDFLRTAEVTAREEIPGSLNRPLKVTLVQGDVRAHAIFRTVDVERDKMDHVQAHARGFRDCYVYEVAAYELSRLLGIDNVPPAVMRTLDGEQGSLQLWVEEAMGVRERLAQGIDARHEKLWMFQKQNMQVFDNLIYNFDRNPGNMLIDSGGKLWFVDHTRAFKILPALADRGEVKVLERQLWQRLQALDADEVRERLAPYLRQTEINALLARQKKLVKWIEKRIARHGEQAILFEFVTAPA